MAAPLLIIKGIRRINENKVRITLFKSSREADISTFFRLQVRAHFEEFSIAEAILKKSEKDNTLFSEELMSIRNNKYIDIDFPNDNVDELEIMYQDTVRSIKIE